LPAIDRRSGRSRYTSATRSSSKTATRCSPTSTETSSSRLACGSGALRGGSRRRRCCGRSRSRRGPAVFLSVLGALVAVFAFGCGADSVFASAVAVFRVRPRPPRLPRRRLGLVVLDCPASSAGSVLTGSGVADGAAASLGAFSLELLDRNQRKKNLLRARALRQRRLERRRGACAAGCGRWKTSAHRVPTGPAGPAVRSRT
jgi:hypothetical protein